MFPSFTSCASFALPHALVAGAGKVSVADLVGLFPCAVKDRHTGDRARGVQQRAEQRGELLEERDF